MSTGNFSAEIDKLRNNIDFAATSQFFHTFQSAFHPWPVPFNPASLLPRFHYSSHRAKKHADDDYVFSTEDLENMLLDNAERYRLQELIVRMLRLLTRNRFINNETWQMYFSREIDKRGLPIENPFYEHHEEEGNQLQQDNTDKDETLNVPALKKATIPAGHDEEKEEEDDLPKEERKRVNFFDLSLDQRIYLLHILCEWQLDDAERFREHLDSEEDAVHWRVDPIGYDAKGSLYWLFDDNRLYKETPEPKQKQKPKKKPARRTRVGMRRSTRRNAPTEQGEEDKEEEPWVPWQLLCVSSQQWEEFPKRFENSTHPDEQNFYSLLVNDVLPKVLPALKEHEDALRKKEALSHRKRSSRLISRELEALERDQRQHQLNIIESSRRSSRREEQTRKREEKEKEDAARAREERLKDRERRLLQRELAQAELEKRMAIEESKREAMTAQSSLTPLRQTTHQQQSPTVVPKKRGRKPKQKKQEEDVWQFDCICGVSGKNLDDGTPMIACERCGKWEHIRCLQKDGQLTKAHKSFDNYNFFCRSCAEKESQEVDIDGLDDEQTKAPPLKKLTIIQSQHPLPPLPPQSIRHNHPHAASMNGHHFFPVHAHQPTIEPRMPELQQQQQQCVQSSAPSPNSISPLLPGHSYPVLRPINSALQNNNNGNGHLHFSHYMYMPPLPTTNNNIPPARPHLLPQPPATSAMRIVPPVEPHGLATFPGALPAGHGENDSERTGNVGDSRD
ncbi:hypothetical protein BX666DRAFT_890283 [Dichotomocladium elegans]|nr:hypothetical protein BX666DRAFT_890283 [Dichotomocladium elegans]